jgi:ech hydrogenase subunit E
MIFPLGPYHPALTEPMALRLALRGETVTGVETQLGYVHRGVEALATTRDLPAALELVERVCGTCGHSQRLALCLALERLAGVKVPERAQVLRTVFSEVERLQARLYLLMQVARAGEFGALFTSAVEARETLFEACVAATGLRLFWGVAVPGGALGVDDPMVLATAMDDIEASVASIEKLLNAQGPVLRRTLNLGKVPEDAVTDLGVTGLLARAAGTGERDVRLETPYDAYRGQKQLLADSAEGVGQLTGDVASRLRLAAVEIRQSMQIIATLLEDLPGGQERATFPAVINPGEATASVEGPHGRDTVTAQVGADGGKPVNTEQPGWLSALSLQTASMTNIGVLPIALDRQRLSDVPLIIASLDLCIACVDR